jgi:hypothetical protein
VVASRAIRQSRGSVKLDVDVRALAREHGPVAFRRLIELIQSDNESVAVRAAEAVLDRAYGRPVQAMEILGAVAHVDVSALSDVELRAHVLQLRPRVQGDGDQPGPLTAPLLEAEAELYARQLADPLRTWQPTPRQRLFIERGPHGHPRDRALCRGEPSGQELSGRLLWSDACPLRDGPPRGAYSPASGISVWDRATSGLVVSVSFLNSRDVIQPLYFDNGMAARGTVTAFIPPRECAEWSVTDQVLKLKNGSVITFRSADRGREKFQVLTRDWMHVDVISVATRSRAWRPSIRWVLPSTGSV